MGPEFVTQNRFQQLRGGLFKIKTANELKKFYRTLEEHYLLEDGGMVVFLGMRFVEEPSAYPEDPPDREFFYSFLWQGKKVEFNSWLSYEKFFDRHFTLVSLADK